jgi:hypothetical protein
VVSLFRRLHPMLSCALLCSVLVALALLPTLALAQATGNVQPPDWSAIIAGVITGVVPLLIPVLVYGVRLAIPSIPRAWVPFIAIALGPVVTWLAQLAGAPGIPILKAALLGALSIVVREIWNTVQEHGLLKA